ncbi:MAG: formate--tetrahydrofolate ligase [Nitrospirota bacterium]|nr:formate--tetrahydrofolate ligase [Nitrospirota bacterium]
MTDLEIAHSVSPRPIQAIGEMLGLKPEDLILYGPWKAKVSLSALERLANRPRGRYVLVTAINPTPLGEGKTTTSVGLAMGLSRLGRRAVVTLRQPSLGPVFGIKGGGTGGGRAQVLPMEDINLHFTGDAHAAASAHNLLSSFLDNHVFQGNSLNLDPARIAWPRAMGISDRALRQVRLKEAEGRTDRDSEFVLTEASEVMAILALASGVEDLRRRLGRILVGVTKEGQPITAAQLQCTGAMAVLLRDALCPNLVQTIEGTPALVHTGPFGNIAHGNCSVLADQLALRTADYVVTEAGFGSDLGAEKFFNIKCRTSGLRPHAAVVVATLRALKLHGGGGQVKAGTPLPPGLTGPNREALAKGLANLEQHLANVRTFGVPAVVAINAFKDDPADELRYVRDWAASAGAVGSAISTHWADGGRGAEELAKVVEAACKIPSAYQPLYPDEAPIKQKIEAVATRIYGAAGVSYEERAEADIKQAVRLGFGTFPVCMAKTPLSLSHDPALKGRPTGFTLPVKELRILAGAGFLTAVCSGIQLMPGLPKKPAGERMDLDPATGEITGLS